jgi:hypothetical protein
MDYKLFIFVITILVLHIHITEFVIKKGKAHYRKLPLSPTSPLSPSANPKLLIWDIIQSNTADYSKYNYSKNTYLLLFIVPFLYGVFTVNSDVRRAALGELGLKFVIILGLRSLSMATTILPKSATCEPFSAHGFRRMMNWFVGGGCYDKMFSGHLSFGILLSLLMFKHGFIKKSPARVMVMFAINAFHLILLAATRSHFTVDLVVASYVTIGVFLAIK